MFDLERKIFLTESYFENAKRQENGEWKYSVEHCVSDFQNAFPNFPVDYQKLVQPTVGRKAGQSAQKKNS
jgi:hypothetical protein